MMVLDPSYFPLYTVGTDVRTPRSVTPLFTCSCPSMASDVAFRLNQQEMSKWCFSPAQGDETLTINIETEAVRRSTT